MVESKDSAEMTRAERIFVRISIVQTVLAVTGFLIAVIALFAALNEADAVRKQQMASVWPHVTIRDVNFNRTDNLRTEVVVGNRGIGPARIFSAEIIFDGESAKSWSEVVEALSDNDDDSFNTYRISGAVLAPEEDLIAFGVSSKYASPDLVRAVQDVAQSGRINMRICYCSVFDDCWELDALAEQTVPVDSCAPTTLENGI